MHQNRPWFPGPQAWRTAGSIVDIPVEVQVVFAVVNGTSQLRYFNATALVSPHFTRCACAAAAPGA